MQIKCVLWMRRRQVQDEHGQCRVHRLWGWKILNKHRRNGGGNVSSMSKQFQLAQSQHSPRCLHLQRRVHWACWRLVYCLCHWKIQDKHWQCGVHRLRGWNVLDEHGRDTGGDVSCVPDQHVFRGVGVGLPGVPGQRAFCGWECFTGLLLLQERVCACGGLVHLSDL